MSQDRLFDIATLPPGTANPVLAFDPSRWTNGHRVLDLARLGYLPEPVLDPTYGLGGMWAQHRPDHLIGCDLDRSRARDVRCDFNALPFADRSFASCLFDPPYKMSGENNPDAQRGNHGELTRRFDATATRELWASIVGTALAECSRVTSRVLIVKCQDQIDSARYMHQSAQIADAARHLGWWLAGQLHLNNYISQPTNRPQQAIRNNYSTFLVFKR